MSKPVKLIHKKINACTVCVNVYVLIHMALFSESTFYNGIIVRIIMYTYTHIYIYIYVHLLCIFTWPSRNYVGLTDQAENCPSRIGFA